MKIVLISFPVEIPEEVPYLENIFDQGLEYFHARKPGFTRSEMEDFIKRIPARHHNKIILHSHFDLIEKYKMRGMHVSPQELFKYSGYDGHISSSFHSIEEIKGNRAPCNYAFLSPVFDSISKAGYQSPFDAKILKGFLDEWNSTEILALGGVDESKIGSVRSMGFPGFAVLGGVWMSKDPVEAFRQIKSITSSTGLELSE